MKISTSVRAIYDERKELYEALKEDVDNIVTSFKKRNWHYESRVKDINSFALKVETGRFSNISTLEDFMGACLVVENYKALEEAEQLLTDKFNIQYRRPRSNGVTHKDPSSFVFDDIRLYLTIATKENRKNKQTDNVIFELQIKTFLQHAWSIATHDLVYKGDHLDWSSNRIAYQVKAMLEHAEISISEYQSLSSNPALVTSNKEYNSINQILQYLTNTWDSAQLPVDMIRLSRNIYELARKAYIEVDDLLQICKDSKFVGEQPKKNISPYTAIALSLIDHSDSFVRCLRKRRKQLFLTNEAIELLSERQKGLVEQVRISI